MARPKLKLLWGSGTASLIRYLLISYSIMRKNARKTSDNGGSLFNEDPFYMPEGRGIFAGNPPFRMFIFCQRYIVVTKWKTWSKDINSLKKIKTIMKDIRKDVAQAYKSVYTENGINQTQSKQMISDEVIRIFSERYGIDYGWEPFKD